MQFLVRTIVSAALVVLLAHCSDGAKEVNSASPTEKPLTDMRPAQGQRSASGIDLNTVLCNRAYFLNAKTYLDVCVPAGDKDLKEDLVYSIEMTTNFLVSTSQNPDAMKEFLERDSGGMLKELKSLPGSKIAAACSIGPADQEHGMFAALAKYFRDKSRAERRADVTKLLSVPGPELRMCFP